jgi:hypothetical protein
MSKRNRNHAGKHAHAHEHEGNTVIVKPPKPAVSSPREQLRRALGELRTSTAFLFETALSEVQHGATAIVQELKSRATTLLASIKGAPRVAGKGHRMKTEHSNPALS